MYHKCHPSRLITSYPIPPTRLGSTVFVYLSLMEVYCLLDELTQTTGQVAFAMVKCVRLYAHSRSFLAVTNRARSLS